MRDFATLESITPILEEIRTRYTADRHPVILKSLNCIALLKSRTTRDALAIRTPENGGFYYSGPAARALLKELKSWTEAAETEPGELDAWLYREESRIMEAIRSALIKEYGRTI